MSYKDYSDSEDETDFHDVDSTFNETLEDHTIEAEKNNYRVSVLTNQFSNLKSSDEAVEEVNEGIVVGEANQCPVQAEVEVQVPVNMPYDSEDANDGADYYKLVGNIKLEWDPDVHFWFNAVEASLKRAQVFKQWTKREMLMPLLPPHVLNEVRHLYRLPEDEAGDLPYKTVKQAIIKKFGRKPQESVDKALSRVLTSDPSSLARELIEDICKCKPALDCKCCADVVIGLLRKQLPIPVRNAIAGRQFNKDTYQSVLDHADEVFNSNKPDGVAVAAVAAAPEATSSKPAQEVASVRGGGNGGRGNGRGARGGSGNGRGGRGFRGGGRGSGRGGGGGYNNQPQSNLTSNKGPRHADSPPLEACQTHWTFGKSATYCRKPHTCPWKQYIQPE